jgi:hypothetical protein
MTFVIIHASLTDAERFTNILDLSIWGHQENTDGRSPPHPNSPHMMLLQYQTFLRWTELPYFDSSRTHDVLSLSIHTIRNIVNHFLDANLNNLDTASQTRTPKINNDYRHRTYCNTAQPPFQLFPFQPLTGRFPSRQKERTRRYLGMHT